MKKPPLVLPETHRPANPAGATPSIGVRRRRRSTPACPRGIFGPFRLTDGIAIGQGPRLWIRKDLRRDLLDIERAAALLDDACITAEPGRLFPDSGEPVKAILARRSAIDFLLALDGIEVWTPGGPGRGPGQRAWIRFREGREQATNLLLQQAWSSLVMAAWRERKQGAEAAGLRSPRAPFHPKRGVAASGKPAKTLLVRHGASWGSLAFANPSEAIEIHRINQAISKSRTWKQLKRRMPKDKTEELLPRIMEHPCELGELACHEDAGESMPNEPTGRFKTDMIPGYEDGDYPLWLQTSMHHDLPDDIVRDFGTWEDTEFNGDFLEIKVADRLAVGRRLAAQGIRVLDGSRLSFH